MIAWTFAALQTLCFTGLRCFLVKKVMGLVPFSILIYKKWAYLPNKVKFSNLNLPNEVQSRAGN